MRFNRAFLAVITVVTLFSCRKDHGSNLPQPPSAPPDIPASHVLLKDIIMPHLPSPYYHFEYDTDSLVTRADFGSGFTTYDIIYNGTKVREMRNNILVNHDTLRYNYDSGDKVTVIDFINQSNVIYRHAYFNYQDGQVREISWNRRDENGDFPVDRILTFSYYPDGNVKSIEEQRRLSVSEPWQITIKMFEQYDKEINVDDFSLIHDGIHDHLFLLQGFRLQKNNPLKETLSVNGADFYSVDYNYVYNSDHTPSTKTGDLLFKSGADAGKRFVTNTIYTYY